MHLHTATIRGSFLAVPRPERFASLRARPWKLWTENDIFHLKDGQTIDLAHFDGTGFHAVRIRARRGNADITGTFLWREATEAHQNEFFYKIREDGAHQTDVVMMAYFAPTMFVAGAPFAVWFGGMFLDALAVVAGVVVTALYHHAKRLEERYGTPRWFIDPLSLFTVSAPHRDDLVQGDPRILFRKATKDNAGMAETTDAPIGGDPTADTDAKTVDTTADIPPAHEPLPVLLQKV